MAQKFQNRAQSQDKRTQLLPETMLAGDPLPSGVPPAGTVVVTISRQFSSGGSELAHRVAHMSGLNYVDQQIIAEVAERLGVDVQNVARKDEQTGSMSGHILEALRASTPFNVNYRSLFDTTSTMAKASDLPYFYLTQKVILEMATQGNVVIVGRGSQFLLHNVPRTLHIYVFAPLPDRIESTMRRFHIDHDAASDLIERRDYEQASYLRRYYGADGQRPDLYHLLINMGLFSTEMAADLIHQALPIARDIA
ncbi:MAG TPA: cytidylate kinase-like family protein [Ktedonobacteraceae bacterium]|nr:cytidylate kinase-like family protein [Ktedonobacteraceae bacterium]